jgi:hypothetical protein
MPKTVDLAEILEPRTPTFKFKTNRIFREESHAPSPCAQSQSSPQRKLHNLFFIALNLGEATKKNNDRGECVQSLTLFQGFLISLPQAWVFCVAKVFVLQLV